MGLVGVRTEILLGCRGRAQGLAVRWVGMRGTVSPAGSWGMLRRKGARSVSPVTPGPWLSSQSC